jgi:methionine-rich copper-binding protein CopC
MAWRPSLVLSALIALVPLAARAHAIIVDSAPAVNATVAGPDVDVALRFNSRIDHERSSITLSRVGTPPGTQPAPLPLLPEDSPEFLKAHVTGLAAGAYSLRWQVLSVDGHITRGDIPFKVGR